MILVNGSSDSNEILRLKYLPSMTLHGSFRMYEDECVSLKLE